ncbi:SOS response-associated peptidase [Homoserinibacter sp. YIM 151385]|uniref:SOS response-associated peptidase n=1 Tax=Homoserinibacter sp. YIM 151385 TaxID=2985506 RepID=UPI0022F04CD0|nr:SOS response-associated peptidase [Homoserinibacter sp. YIM 151385]WBU37433.1 SOS response-associated peptidase [Homoserinibacter sp. YIM 151385]
MCGRFANDAETNEMIEQFVLEGNDYRDWQISYSIAPTDTVPIVRERADRASGEIYRGLEPAVWDFRPAFITEPKRPNFNARLETVATNGMWRSAFAGSRCIVPMRGYYEWTGEKGDKQPHYLHRPDGALLAAAGICTARKVEGAWEVSTAIITREGVDASGEVHDRMPAFLTEEVYGDWLEPVKLDAGRSEQTLAMLERVSAEVAATMIADEVDRRLNSSRAVDPADASLIAPLA